jgi:hypothetical protein
MVGGVLGHAGVDGFLANLDDLYTQIDDEEVQWEAFLRTWHVVYGDRAVTTADIAADLRGEDGRLRASLPPDLAESLADDGKGRTTFSKRLGQALRKRVDAVFGDLRLRRLGRSGQNVNQWQVCVTDRRNAGFPDSRRADDGARGVTT